MINMSFIIILAGMTTIIMSGSFLMFFMSRFKKVQPGKLMVISGRKNIHPLTGEIVEHRLIKGGGSFILPIESYGTLPCELISLNRGSLDIYDRNKRRVTMDFTAHIRPVNLDTEVLKFVSHFSGKSSEEIKNILCETIEDKIKLFFEDISVEHGIKRNELKGELQDAITYGLGEMGMELSLFNIKKIEVGM